MGNHNTTLLVEHENANVQLPLSLKLGISAEPGMWNCGGSWQEVDVKRKEKRRILSPSRLPVQPSKRLCGNNLKGEDYVT